MSAILRGHIEIVGAVLERNADVDIQDERGNTALFYATQIGQFNMVEAILERNAEVDI
jgi:ankyrin repeat protein